jgi:cytidine deaminase
MKDLKLNIQIKECQLDELSDIDRSIINMAIEATDTSYAPHSHFRVGACVLLADGTIQRGCNQENAAFPAGICAERSAIFAAGAQHPDQAVKILAIAARDTQGELTQEPVSPCGTCRQVMIETEDRYKQPMEVLLYGEKETLVFHSAADLLPLIFVSENLNG